MALTAVSPVSGSLINPGDDISFTIDDTYTTLQIEVVVTAGTEYAYDLALGGGQGGYTVQVVDNGATKTFTFSRNAGFDLSPVVIRVIENETGSTATTSLTYDLVVTTLFPRGMQPYDPTLEGSLIVSEDDTLVRSDVSHIDVVGAVLTDEGNGKVKIDVTAGVAGVASFEARTGAVISNAGDYNSSEITNVSGVVGASVGAALDTLLSDKAIDTDVFHDNVDGEIAALTEKTVPANDDLFVINDSAASDALKKIKFSNIISGAAPVVSVFGRTGAIAATAGDYTATKITNTPAGNIAAVTVQAALDELDGDKQPKMPGEPNGFVNRDDCVLSFVDGTRTLTLTGTYDIWSDGTKYSKAGDTFVISATEGNHFVYYDGTGTLAEITAFDISLIDQYCYVAYIYWDAVNSEAVPDAVCEQHGTTMDARTHEYLHRTQGTKFDSGLALTMASVGGTGNNATDAQFSSAVGVIWDEDIKHTILSRANGDLLPVIYKTGASGLWRMDDSAAFPVLTTGTGRAAYNEWTGVTWQQTEVTNNRWVLSHIFAVPGVNATSGYLVAVQGEAEYSSLALAQAGAQAEITALSLDGLPFQEFKEVGTIIFQTNNTYANAVKSRVVAAGTGEDYVDWRLSDFNAAGSTAASVAWGNISGTLSNQTDLDTALDAKVEGPASATDNAIARFDGTTGKLLQDGSNATLDDLGHLALTGSSVALQLAERTTAPANETARGHFWVKDDVPTTPWFTDDVTGDYRLGDAFGPASSTDNAIARFDSTTGKLLQDSSTSTLSDNSALDLTGTEAEVRMAEQASVADPTAGYGRFWVKSDVPSTPYFTDDTNASKNLLRPQYHYIWTNPRQALTTALAYSRTPSYQPYTYQSWSTNCGATQGTPTAPTMAYGFSMVPWDGTITRVFGNVKYWGTSGSGTYDTDLEIWKWNGADADTVYTGSAIGSGGIIVSINDATTGTASAGIQIWNMDVAVTANNTVVAGDQLEYLFYNQVLAVSGYPNCSLCIEIQRT